MTAPTLQQGYRQARLLNARHGRTYYLSTLLLPRAKRPAVHALYGFARYADDIVDSLQLPLAERVDQFERWADRVLTDLARGDSSEPLCLALLDTIDRWQIPLRYFADFLASMRADLTVAEYPSYSDLADYMWGSAAVIGLQMLPILQRRPGCTEELDGYAADLGRAFQLTNFLRDIGEDLDRGRVYLPQDTLRRFGTDTAALRQARLAGRPDSRIRDVLAYEIDRARGLYRDARPGIDLVHPTSRPCLLAAWRLYSEILDEIERADYNVFRTRVATSPSRRAAVAVPGLLRSWSARARFG